MYLAFTSVLFTKYLAKFGISTDFVSLTDLTAWQQAIKPNTRLLFFETPSNPLNDVADLRALSALAKQHQCLLAVDNCFAHLRCNYLCPWGGFSYSQRHKIFGWTRALFRRRRSGQPQFGGR